VELFRSKRGTAPTIARGRDAKILGDLAKERGPDEAARLLRAYFTTADDFVASRGYSLPIFQTRINALLGSATATCACKYPERYGHGETCTKVRT
jgi:hypothetical protein